MPGLLLCFVMRYDNYKKQAAVAADIEQSKITYFHCSLIGYIIGKIASMELNMVFKNTNMMVIELLVSIKWFHVYLLHVCALETRRDLNLPRIILLLMLNCSNDGSMSPVLSNRHLNLFDVV